MSAVLQHSIAQRSMAQHGATQHGTAWQFPVCLAAATAAHAPSACSHALSCSSHAPAPLPRDPSRRLDDTLAPEIKFMYIEMVGWL